MAHKVKGIPQSYSSHETEELLKNYESALPSLVPKSVPELEMQLEKSEEEKDKRIRFLEQRLLDNGLAINKMLANFEDYKKANNDFNDAVKEKLNIPEKVQFDNKPQQ